MKLAIDLGNSNIKFVGDINGEIAFKSIRSLVTTNSLDTNYVVSHKGNTIHFGVGDSLVEVDKTDRKYIKETILLGVHQLYGATDKALELDLALGLPLDLYKSSKKHDFEDKVKTLTNVVIDGEVNGEPVLVKVKSITVCAEGYSAFLNLAKDIDKDYAALIIDEGFGTTDYIGVTFINGKWQIDGFGTVDKGLYDVFDAVKSEVLDKEKIKALNGVLAVENKFLNNPMVLTKTGEFDINNYLYAAKPVVDSIITDINKKFSDMHSRKIYVVGGGAEIFTKVAGVSLQHKQDIKLATRLYANAIGYLLQIK